MDASFGACLREARRERGWSQVALATEVDVAPRHVSDWETGRVDVRLSTLRRLAEALGVPVERLLRDE